MRIAAFGRFVARIEKIVLIPEAMSLELEFYNFGTENLELEI